MKSCQKCFEKFICQRYGDYYDEAIFFDNENGFVGIAEYKNKKWSQLAEPLPEWMISFLKYIKESNNQIKLN